MTLPKQVQSFRMANKHHRAEWQQELLDNKAKLEDYLHSYTKPPTLYELSTKINCSLSYIGHKIHTYGLESYIDFTQHRSHYEDEIISYINSIYNGEILLNDRTVIAPQEVDIYLPTIKIAIEFNGNYWHSNRKISKNYHRDKTLKALKNNIKLFHIFEYQWINNSKLIKKNLKIILNSPDKFIIDIGQVDCVFYNHRKNTITYNKSQDSPYRIYNDGNKRVNLNGRIKFETIQ